LFLYIEAILADDKKQNCISVGRSLQEFEERILRAEVLMGLNNQAVELWNVERGKGD
jgi:hypothetical protein